MNSGPRSSRSATAYSRSGSGTNRPLGVSIICVLGGIGFVFAFVPILQLLSLGGMGAGLALLFLILNFAQLAVIVGLWHMSATALTWAYVFYGLGLLVELATLNLLGAIVSIIMLAYLASVSDTFR